MVQITIIVQSTIMVQGTIMVHRMRIKTRYKLFVVPPPHFVALLKSYFCSRQMFQMRRTFPL